MMVAQSNQHRTALHWAHFCRWGAFVLRTSVPVPTDAERELLTFEEVGEQYLGISRQAVSARAKKRQLPVITIGTRRFVPRKFFTDAIDDAISSIEEQA
jgi:hypothetical protein